MVAQPLLHLQLFVFLCNLYMLLCVSFQPNCIPLIPLDLHLQGPVAYSAYGIIDHCQCQVHSVEHPQHLQSQVFQFVVPISWVCMKPTLVVGPVDSEMSNDIRVVCHVNLDKACGGGHLALLPPPGSSSHGQGWGKDGQNALETPSVPLTFQGTHTYI